MPRPPLDGKRLSVPGGDGNRGCASRIFRWARPVGGSSADFQSAVSQNCILRDVRPQKRAGSGGHAADYKSAIQQIENLRYVRGKPEKSEMRTGDGYHRLTMLAPGPNLFLMLT